MRPPHSGFVQVGFWEVDPHESHRCDSDRLEWVRRLAQLPRRICPCKCLRLLNWTAGLMLAHKQKISGKPATGAAAICRLPLRRQCALAPGENGILRPEEFNVAAGAADKCLYTQRSQIGSAILNPKPNMSHFVLSRRRPCTPVFLLVEALSAHMARSGDAGR